MVRLLIAFGVLAAAVAVFAIGISSALPLPLFCGFMTVPFALFGLGWNASTAARGRRLKVSFSPEQMEFVRQADLDRAAVERLARRPLPTRFAQQTEAADEFSEYSASALRTRDEERR